MLDLDEDSPFLYGALIDEYFGNKIDLILDPGEYEFLGESTSIVDFTTGTPIVMREAAGDVSFLK
jgi:tRNA A37 threonylcarbamoyladenosine synthetase subunit TsaC/SUA5/YrdC